MPISSRVKHWLHGLGAAFIGGGATVIVSQTGLAMAQTVGVHSILMDLKTMGIVFVSSGVVATMNYLKQSPLPPESTGNTETFTR